MADIKLAYGPSFDATITLTGLAYDASFVTGRESSAISNSAGLYLDYLIAGKIGLGAFATVGAVVQICVVGSIDGTTWPDAFDGTDSAETVTAGVKNSICRVVAAPAGDFNANQVISFGPVSVASAFGGVLPKAFVVFVINGSGIALSSTAANHKITLTPVYETVA